MQILHTDTKANHLYGSMCTHVPNSLILWCLYCYELSLSFDSDHLHEDEIVFVLQLVEWIAYFIIFFLYVWSYVCIFVIFLNFSYLFVCHLLIWNISFFPFLLLHFLRKCRLNYTHELYTDTSFIIVSYFANTFYCTHFCSFMRYFQCFSSPFSAVIIMSICTHSHGSAKNWWHSLQSINGYMLTSTKI